MKKIVLLIVLAAMSQGVVLFAQQNFTHESPYAFFNFSIERVYAHRLGFVILYRTPSGHVARTHLPREWFAAMGGRGAIAYIGPGREWPSMSVFYRDGEFSHMLLRLARSRAHQTWGVIPLNVDIDQNFMNIEEPDIQF